MLTEGPGRDQARLALQTLRSYYLFDFNAALDTLNEVSEPCASLIPPQSPVC